MPPRPSRRDHHSPRRTPKPTPLSAGRRPHKHTNLTTPIPRFSEDELFESLLPSLDCPFLLVLDGVQDPHNLGACLRSANAAGAHAVIAPKDKAAPLTETVRRIACGGAEHTPFIQVTNLARALKKLKDAGLWLVGTADEATQVLYDVDLKGPLAIVLGAEEKGVRRLTRENCDFLVRIPMHGHVDCLNVSVATGVCLFEAVRQRTLA
ncbi:MAG: 23S rRNA (guanosine(2251)-2'-O)-methyltransferase RlmB [Verrucomicrobiota bacterium]